MYKFILILVLCLLSHLSNAQTAVDLEKSVPLWLEYDSINEEEVIHWIGDENATSYTISEVTENFGLVSLATLEGSDTSYPIGNLVAGERYALHVRKNSGGTGIITVGREIPAVHERGRCLITIDNILVEPLSTEISQLMTDMSMDGWEVDTVHVAQAESVLAVKSLIIDWYDIDYEKSQSLFLLGHIPVPYSGNSAHDGHGNHQGAWAADVFYGELTGQWTDISVNNVTPSREENKNIPGDGKYDQTSIPTSIELEVGRVDFSNLPAFNEDEIELTRQYLVKNHEFKMGKKDYPRRGLVENNFGSFAEGFGQSGWRNFTTMFKGDSVTVKNYEQVLAEDKYLFTYACGGGSYTSCAGVGTTQNLWVEKDIQTVFTMNFGSYFGDWDSQNNFLRAALASGDVLTNAWAGRPVWQFYDMALGRHIGHCAKLTQDASGFFFNQGFSSRSAHIALMGDPTLRLHAMKPAGNLTASFDNGDISIMWNASPDETDGYYVYRQTEDAEAQLLATVTEIGYLDECVESNMDYTYIVKAVRLEESGSGSYYNTSLGISASIFSGENINLATYYYDGDNDGYGDIDSMLLACNQPSGFVSNNEDCDDTNPLINPEAVEIANNDIDEDCDGSDLLVDISEQEILEFSVAPNPSSGIFSVRQLEGKEYTYRVLNSQGMQVQQGILGSSIDLTSQVDGIYWLEIKSGTMKNGYSQVIVVMR